jgi:hypothetical protein
LVALPDTGEHMGIAKPHIALFSLASLSIFFCTTLLVFVEQV